MNAIESKSFTFELPLFHFSWERRTEKTSYYRKKFLFPSLWAVSGLENHAPVDDGFVVSMTFRTMEHFPTPFSHCTFCKPTVVYGALGWVTIGGFREDVVVRVVLMLESNRAEHQTIRPNTGASGRTATDAQNHKNTCKCKPCRRFDISKLVSYLI